MSLTDLSFLTNYTDFGKLEKLCTWKQEKKKWHPLCLKRDEEKIGNSWDFKWNGNFIAVALHLVAEFHPLVTAVRENRGFFHYFLLLLLTINSAKLFLARLISEVKKLKFCSNYCMELSWLKAIYMCNKKHTTNISVCADLRPIGTF